MTQTEAGQIPAATQATGRFTRAVLGGFARQFENSPVSFAVTLPDGSVQSFGPGPARFSIGLKNANALKAVASMDEGRFGDAYVHGDIDLEGDMLSPFELRGAMKDALSAKAMPSGWTSGSAPRPTRPLVSRASALAKSASVYA